MVQVGDPHPLFTHELLHQGTLKLQLKGWWKTISLGKVQFCCQDIACRTLQ